jgi:hypothetical protein
MHAEHTAMMVWRDRGRPRGAPSGLARLSRRALTPCWKNLNQLRWVDGFAFASHGVRLGVRVNDPALLPMLRKHLPQTARPSAARVVDRYFSVILGGSREGSRVRRYHLLYVDHTLYTRSLDLDDMLAAFESVVRLSVAELAPRRVFIHAGVVGWKGHAILVPGKTFSGKTSLVAELVKAGATYYSDEFAVIDARARVHPFAQPLGVREKGSDRQRSVPVEEIGGRAGSKLLPVGLVVVSEYKPGARWRPRRLSGGLGALALLSNTVGARRRPGPTLATLERVVASASIVKTKRGEAAAAAPHILRELEGADRPRSRCVSVSALVVDRTHVGEKRLRSPARPTPRRVEP